MSVSVLVLTLNEELNIRRCLESVAWCDDVVVVDSFSTDQTVEIAKAMGARVISRKLDDWASHLNWINANVTFRHDWVYYSDADELVPDDLRDELIALAKNRTPYAAFRVRYKNYFMGRWIKHSGSYPIWVMRFFKPKLIKWARSVNPTPIVDGEEGKLSSHFDHYSFNKGMDWWFEKHNRYSTGEASESLRSLRAGAFALSGLLSADPAERRRCLKELSFRLPARFLLRFVYMYILRGGFIDGIPGLHWSLLNACYEYMIEIKIVERLRHERGASM
jgi:glycosyltransferase involved in cell wall biosynthesis